jgi:outer membrane receptor protein involved in Fe transport
MHRRAGAGLGLSIATLLAASPALAQNAGDAPAAAQDNTQGQTLEMIVVTATKRGTSLQETPLAITAISATTLADIGATDVKDYAKLVPGLSVQDDGPGSTRLTMRGIYSTGEPTTGLYYDETPISGFVGPSSDSGGRSPQIPTFDVERVEALRGPQGTLYGASSMSGVIRVIYQKPKLNTYEGAAEGSYAVTDGGDPSWRTDGMVNVPLIKDTLAVRAVLSKRDDGGYVDNLRLDQNNVNWENSTSGRLELRYRPTESLTFDLSYYNDKTSALAPGISLSAGVPYGSTSQIEPPYSDNTQLYNFTLNWDLGGATLTAVSSYLDRSVVYAVDASYYMDAISKQASTCQKVYNHGTPCNTATMAQYTAYVLGFTPSAVYYPGSERDSSNEVRLSSKHNKVLDWTGGVYEENRRTGLFSEDAMADRSTGSVIQPVELYYQRHIYDQLKQQAAYGETIWHVVHNLDLTTGLRYYHYDRSVTGDTDMGQPLIGAAVTPATTAEATQSGWLKKVDLSYQVAPDAMVYAMAADGLRPGGANQVIGLPQGLVAYKADSLWDYEAGMKSSWLSEKLYTEAAFYQIDWHDMQINARTANGAYSFITNAGDARIRGLEFSVMYRPITGLELALNGNTVDARLTTDQINNNISASSTLGRKGDYIPYTPKFSGDLSAAYRRSLSSALIGMARIDANYAGKSYSTLRTTDPAHLAMGNYTLVNLRLGLEDGGNRWAAYVFIDNLMNRYAITTAEGNVNFWPNGMAFSAPPRTVGVDFRLNFF